MTTDAYDRALSAEPRLRALARMVETACATAPTTAPFCSSCYWETVLKPLTTPLVGWGRGWPPEQATDERRTWQPLDLDAVLDGPEPATSETEAWLRGTTAYDAVTNRWLAQLYAADPGLGHGLPSSNKGAMA